MNPLALVRPLEEDWREAIDAVARSRGWPTTRDVARLGARVAELSAAYNDPGRARAAVREAGAARLGFSFARDVPKGAAAVRELVAAGALPLDRPLRVLDVGAGLGATTWGLARALRAAGSRAPVDATWVDSDAAALDLGRALLAARGTGGDAVEIRARTTSLPAAGGAFDVVLLGQVLSEMDVALPDEQRHAQHLRLLTSLLERLEPPDERGAAGGSLVVVEPALRERSRHLHRLRDALAAAGTTIFAPCLHAAPCPALAREGDWCHEDLAVDLPDWLAPVARAAGLRREGLTFSYLVARRDGTRLAGALRAPHPEGSPPGAARLRVVSEQIRTKGKREAFVCGEFPNSVGSTAVRVRLMLLDRDVGETTAPWERLSRGDVAIVSPPPDLERPRIGPGSSVQKAIVVSPGAHDAESR